ncbi:hypothetical protein [Streptomyces sp. NPDC016845]|uniref:hypothetical protein n=1 Tax=Streptomyces sp. NPDC016845 TaxID=3364972 RepID=UPI0037AC43B3
MRRSRVLIAGTGFAGYRAARTLARAARSTGRPFDVTVLDPADHFPHPPLLPQAAVDTLEPRGVTVSPAAAASDRAEARARTRRLLVDIAPRVLPELDARLSRTSGRVVRERGAEVRTGTSVQPGLVRSGSVPLDTASPEPARTPRTP